SGRQIAWKLLPGIGFLYFMIPLPWVTLKALTERARLFDASMTAMILPWFGIPVFHSGYLLTLPNITLEVADMCSSIPGIAAMLALGSCYGVIVHRPRPICVLLAVVTIPLAIA